MALYKVTHKCGHAPREANKGGEIQLYGKEISRRHEIERRQAVDCADCRLKEGLADAQRLSEAINLPALRGSDRQIAWATKIRVEALRAVEEEVARVITEGGSDDAKALGDKVMMALRLQIAASWWIDHRNNSAVTLMRDAARGAGLA